LEVATPIEAKCDWNKELWIGWRTQLRDRYACEPHAQGFGVYLVFWFGDLRGTSRAVVASPFGDVPSTAQECQEILLRVMADEAPKLVPIVFDLTPMPSQSAEREVRASEKRTEKAQAKAAAKPSPS
jgi:hypothetical protein